MRVGAERHTNGRRAASVRERGRGSGERTADLLCCAEQAIRLVMRVVEAGTGVLHVRHHVATLRRIGVGRGGDDDPRHHHHDGNEPQQVRQAERKRAHGPNHTRLTLPAFHLRRQVTTQSLQHAAIGCLGVIELRRLDHLRHAGEAFVGHDAAKRLLAKRPFADQLVPVAA
jgi:hypothetical protein